jgi:hypothetical protein
MTPPNPPESSMPGACAIEVVAYIFGFMGSTVKYVERHMPMLSINHNQHHFYNE